MAAFVQTYSPGETVVSFKGNVLSGFGDEIVTCKRNNPVFTLNVGADGKGVYIKSADRSGEVTLTFKQTSGANAILGAIVQLDEVAGLQVGPILIADNNGTTLWSGEGRLAGYPETIDRGKDIKDHQWKILCPILEFEFTQLPSVA